MYWWVIINTTSGLRAIGPFREEQDAVDTVLETQQLAGDIGYFDVFPAMATTEAEALKEWHRTKGG